jgi:hypothetical protein
VEKLLAEFVAAPALGNLASMRVMKRLGTMRTIEFGHSLVLGDRC